MESPSSLTRGECSDLTFTLGARNAFGARSALGLAGCFGVFTIGGGVGALGTGALFGSFMPLLALFHSSTETPCASILARLALK